MSDSIIPLSVPNLAGNEWQYVKDCLDTGWISSVGAYVTQLESSVASFVGTKFGVATVNGTSAIHASLVVTGVSPGDMVITPNLTFVATANAVKYAGAEPILVDARDDTWQMDLDLLERFLAEETDLEDVPVHKKSGRRIPALIPVHVQGNMGDMDRLQEIAQQYRLTVIEDAAESLGSSYQGINAGRFGKLGCISFNGNKIISTGGGGMIITDDAQLAQRLKHLTTTAKVDELNYFHDEVGYNYRLVNVLAAIGVAQMEQLSAFIDRKRDIARYYSDALGGVGDIGFQTIRPDVKPNWWLFTIRTKRQNDLLTHLNQQRIISRPFWMPMNQLPMYERCLYVSENDVSRDIHSQCLAIPCSTNISDLQLDRVSSEVRKFFR